MLTRGIQLMSASSAWICCTSNAQLTQPLRAKENYSVQTSSVCPTPYLEGRGRLHRGGVLLVYAHLVPPSSEDNSSNNNDMLSMRVVQVFLLRLADQTMHGEL